MSSAPRYPPTHLENKVKIKGKTLSDARNSCFQVPKVNLDDLFTMKDNLSDKVKSEVSTAMHLYGIYFF